MKGFELNFRQGILSENKWSVGDIDFQGIAKDFSPKDKNTIRCLNSVADGELSGYSMLFKLHQLCEAEKSVEHTSVFYEALFYMHTTIGYEEFRHGVVLKELNSVATNTPSFLSNCAGEDIAHDYMQPLPVWNSPYEGLVSLMLGEITNAILYREAASQVDHPKLKEILINISKDETKHKVAWKEISRRIIQSSAEHKNRFIEAFRTAHFIHQAEICRHFVTGLKDTLAFFPPKVVAEVCDEKYLLLRDLVGSDCPMNASEIYESHLAHNFKLLRSRNALLS